MSTARRRRTVLAIVATNAIFERMLVRGEVARETTRALARAG
jgi:hypothetical protein